ncbi:hypothetical protein KUV50_14375 [Membranicola marinus]|uniref:Seryl-tRNA synthetase n=1 Tax=Membranihabitans marinus TaxID=1227546 RepID=A0A953HW51_9BACT|nr:hypothetical protein [Membranihabitans marinus]MBY5959335.1 hypothetical protein [Membranihabitans marinus]
MNYKRILLAGFPLLFLLLSMQPATAKTDPNPIIEIDALETEADFEQAYETLKEHVKELRTAKRSAETKAEKDQVKKEIKETKKEIKAVKAKALSGGIYIGGGALIVILLLIILL